MTGYSLTRWLNEANSHTHPHYIFVLSSSLKKTTMCEKKKKACPRVSFYEFAALGITAGDVPYQSHGATADLRHCGLAVTQVLILCSIFTIFQPCSFASRTRRLLFLWCLENSTLHWTLNKTRFTEGSTTGGSFLRRHSYIIYTIILILHPYLQCLCCKCACARRVCASSFRTFTSPASQFGLSEEWSHSTVCVCVCVSLSVPQGECWPRGTLLTACFDTCMRTRSDKQRWEPVHMFWWMNPHIKKENKWTHGD